MIQLQFYYINRFSFSLWRILTCYLTNKKTQYEMYCIYIFYKHISISNITETITSVPIWIILAHLNTWPNENHVTIAGFEIWRCNLRWNRMRLIIGTFNCRWWLQRKALYNSCPVLSSTSFYFGPINLLAGPATLFNC